MGIAEFRLTDGQRKALAEATQPFVDAGLFRATDKSVTTRVQSWFAARLFNTLDEPILAALKDIREGHGNPVMLIRNLPERTDLPQTPNPQIVAEEGEIAPLMADYISQGLHMLLCEESAYKMGRFCADVSDSFARGFFGKAKGRAMHKDTGSSIILACIRGDKRASTLFYPVDAMVKHALTPEDVNLLKEALFCVDNSAYSQNTTRRLQTDPIRVLVEENGTLKYDVNIGNLEYLEAFNPGNHAATDTIRRLKRTLFSDKEAPLLKHTLEQGEYLIFDNRRVAHSVPAYTASTAAYAGNQRWLVHTQVSRQRAMDPPDNFTDPFVDPSEIHVPTLLKSIALDTRSYQKTGARPGAHER